jgi:lipopolysaccharide/colanic/teichoic acid biosynthesis glycosyltransferase
VLDRHRVQEVIIADPDFPQQHAVELVDRCHRRGVTVRIAPSTMEILMHRAEFVPGASVPLFELRPPVFDGFDFALKRSFDVLVSVLMLIVLAPLLAVIALAVSLSSRGPVIYRSIRPGIGGTPFACFKFRTMRTDAEQMQADLESLNEATGALFKIRQDQLQEWHKKRYLVLPGMTGLWQVSGRAELDFDDLVRLDFLYLERWSIGLDLTILLKTIPAVFARRGAY